MNQSFVDELYSKTLKLSNGESGPLSSGNHDQNASYDPKLDPLSDDDRSLWDFSLEGWNSPSDLDWEWQRSHDQFHMIGYRDGLTAGKEVFAHALTCLPDKCRGKLVETQEEKDKFQSLYETVHSHSTTDALKLFHDRILTKRSVEQGESADGTSSVAGTVDLSSDILQSYFGQLKSLILKSPAIIANLVLDH